jgi:ADP-heptose:LPS heptosyltransferase
MVPLVSDNPDLDAVLPIDSFESRATPAPLRLAQRIAFYGRVRAARFDWAIDLHCGPRSAFVTWATGAPVRVGYDTRGRRYAYTVRVPRFIADADGKQKVRSAVRVNASLLEPLGVPVRDERLVLRVPAAARDRVRRFLEGSRLGGDRILILVNPAAKWPTKAWPVERYGRLARRLAVQLEADVLILWGPGERPTAERALGEARHASVRLAPPGDLGDVAALIARAALVIGTDSGVSHIAAALDVPSATLFGPTNPAEWHAYDSARHRPVFHEVPCSFCNLTACAWHACLRELGEDRVFAACRDLLALPRAAGERDAGA